MLAWTTTPWTLPSNLALCVNPELTCAPALCLFFDVLDHSFKAPSPFQVSAGAEQNHQHQVDRGEGEVTQSQYHSNKKSTAD